MNGPNATTRMFGRMSLSVSVLSVALAAYRAKCIGKSPTISGIKIALTVFALTAFAFLGGSTANASPVPVLYLDFGPGTVQGTDGFQKFNPTFTSGAGSASYTPINAGYSTSSITVGMTGELNDLSRPTNPGGGIAAISGTYANFYDDWIGNAFSTSSYTLSGLNDSATYTFTIQNYDIQDSSGPTPDSVLVTDATPGGLGNSATASYNTAYNPGASLGASQAVTPAILNVQSSATGTLVIDLGAGNRIDGFELDATPEPAALGLGIVGMSAMILHRSRT